MQNTWAQAIIPDAELVSLSTFVKNLHKHAFFHYKFLESETLFL